MMREKEEEMEERWIDRKSLNKRGLSDYLGTRLLLVSLAYMYMYADYNVLVV